MAFTHDQRVALAQEIAAGLLARSGPETISAIGLHGSVAYGDDDDASDLDLVVVTSSAKVQLSGRVYRLRGVIVDLGVIAAAEYLAEAAHIGPNWPVASSQYSVTLPLHDPQNFFVALRAAHERAMAAATDEPFRRAAALTYLRALDALQGAGRYAASGESAAFHVQQHETLAACALTLGLLQRRAAPNLPRLIESVAREDWGVPGVTHPFAVAAHGAVAATVLAALEAAVGALGDLCIAHGVVWEAADVERFLGDTCAR